MKKPISITLSVIFSIALILVLFLTSMDITIYGNMPDDFVDECVKYEVLDDVGISQLELTKVSEEMFEYLRGNHDTLTDITATINGVPDTPFFNEKECLHMDDCRKLFTGGYDLRRACLIICAAISTGLINLIFTSEQLRPSLFSFFHTCSAVLTILPAASRAISFSS